MGRNHAADPGDRHAGDGVGQPECRRCGKKQLVVLAAIEGLLQGRGGVNWERGQIHLSRYAGLLAKVGEVGREAIA